MKRRSRKQASAIAASLLLMILAAACGTREDNSLGVGFISDQAEFKATRYFASAPDTTTDFQGTQQATNAGNSPSVTFGNRPGYLARGLIRFEEAFWPEPGTVLDSAVVCFSYNDAAGAAESLDVALHRVTTEWGEDRIDPSVFPQFLPQPADTFRFGKAASADSIDVPLLALAQFWVDNPDSNFGFALLPADTTDLMVEVASRNSAFPPVLTLYWNAAGQDTSVATGSEFDNSVYSTTPAFQPLSGQPRRLTVGRGIPTTSILRFPLPELDDRATIHRASLVVHVDSLLSDFNAFPVRFQRVTEEPWAAESTSVDIVAYGITTVASGTETVEFALPGLVQALTENGNLGILMRAHEDRPDTDYFRFHGADSEDPAKVPELRIWYTPGDEEVGP